MLAAARRAARPGGAPAPEGRAAHDADPDRTAGLLQRRVLERVERRLVDEVRVLDDHRQRALARHAAQRLAGGARRGRAQRARRGGERAQLGVLGRRPPHGDRHAGPDLLGRVGAERAPRAARARNRPAPPRAARARARRSRASSAPSTPPSTSLARMNSSAKRRQHLDVLHEHLREVGLAVAGLAEERDDRGRRAAGGGRAPTRAACAADRRARRAARRPCAWSCFSDDLRDLLEHASTPGRPGHRLDGEVGQHLDARPTTAARPRDRPRPGTAPSSRTAGSGSGACRRGAPGSTPARDRPARAGETARDDHLAGVGGGARRVVADLVTEGEHVLRARGVGELRAHAGHRLAHGGDGALASRRRAARRRAARAPAPPASAPPLGVRRRRLADATAGGLRSIAPRRSATIPACSARRELGDARGAAIGILREAAHDRLLERDGDRPRAAPAPGGGGCGGSAAPPAGLPQNGGAPASIS